MATIVFMPYHWASDMNVTFALARKLSRRSHDIHYLTIPDTRDRIRAQGFNWIPAFSQVFPEGDLQKQTAAETQGKAYGAAEFKARLHGMCDALRNDEIGTAVRGIKPDVLLVSSGMPWVGIGAARTGIPVIQFSSTLVSVQDWCVPPFRTGMIPDGSLASKARTMLAWKKLFLRRRFRNKAWDISPELKRLAEDCGFPMNKIDFSVETWPRLRMTELVFCPQEFDFPRHRTPEGALFVESSIDLERKDTAFPWSKLDEKPLVLCALGTLLTTKAAGKAAQFFQMVLDAMRERPHLQAVVAIGPYLKPEDLKCPENTLLTSNIPQLELLKRASVIISHGGFSSVKESIYFGVPMLLVPMSYDEPGNAARVVYHRLGLRQQFDHLSAVTLGRDIDTLLNDASYRVNIRRLSETFVHLEQTSPACAVIEKVLAGQEPWLPILPKVASV